MTTNGHLDFADIRLVDTIATFRDNPRISVTTVRGDLENVVFRARIVSPDNANFARETGTAIWVTGIMESFIALDDILVITDANTGRVLFQR